MKNLYNLPQKNNKTIRLFLKYFFLITVTFSYAQINYNAPWVKAAKISEGDKINFNDVVAAGDSYWENRDKHVKGSGYKLFKRWESYWQNYVDQSGYLPSIDELYGTWQKKNDFRLSRNTNGSSQSDQSNWISMGPKNFLNRPTNSANLGRLNCITPHPTNSDILYAGSPAGGIWKSEDAGLTYVPLSDNLPQIGVSSIAIDYTNPNIIYIATGDDDALDSFSVGIWKSIDGGLSWNPTALNPSNSPLVIHEIEMHSNNPEIMWAATSLGVYKTVNSGDNWTNIQQGYFQSVKQKPGNPSVVYAITRSQFFISNNEGYSFTLGRTFGEGNQPARMEMDVTPINPEIVYVLACDDAYQFGGIYKSSNSGSTFTKTANTADIFNSQQAWYDLALAVSDSDENELYVGVLDIWKSSDGGDSFIKLNEWSTRNAAYTHADIHFLKFYNNELYVGSDGGFFKSSNQGSTFEDFTGNMSISQFYRVSVSKQTSNKIAGGTQDNGGFAYVNQWNNYHGGDGMESVIDPNNENLYYGFIQFGLIFVRNDQAGFGQSEGFIGPEQGNWITPLSINKDSEVFAGYDKLYQFENNNFSEISPSFESNIDVLELDPIDSDIMYVAINEKLYKSTDHGISFINTETFTSDIISIEVNNSFNDIIYLSTAGLSGKVYKSIDQGVTFSDISGNLPPTAKIVIKHQKETFKNVLYLGTHLGIYRYDDTSSEWRPFANNLPTTTVMDLSINIPDNQIIAGTYGRGIWRSEMPSVELAPYDIALLDFENPSLLLSCGSLIPEIFVRNKGQNSISEIEISYSLDNGPVNYLTRNVSIASLDEENIILDELNLASGEHTLNVSVAIENDAFSSNNNKSIRFKVNNFAEVGATNNFENEQDNLLVEAVQNSTALWERGEPNGVVLYNVGSGSNAYATNLDGNYTSNTKSHLYSPCYDLTNIENPILKFNMAFDIEFDWDLLYVQYSTDLGQNWDLLGTSEDPNWYNSSRIAGDGVNNDCYNCVGGQWTGTNVEMSEYSYDLQPLTDSENIIFRFVFHTDEYVTEEGVVLDNLVIEGNESLNTTDYELQQIVVYPNPSSDIFNIKMSTISDFEISVTDITGKLLFRDLNPNGSSNYSLDMTNFSSGVYFLRVDANNRQFVKKLILN